MPLHDRAEAGHLCCAAVEVQRRKRACKPGNIKAPEQNTGCRGRKPGVKLASQFCVLCLLIAAPVHRDSVLPGKSGSAEQNPLRTDKIAVCVGIVPCVAILSGFSVAAIHKAHVRAIDELAAIGFEAVNAHVEKILTF